MVIIPGNATPITPSQQDPLKPPVESPVFGNRLYPKHPLGLTSSRLSRLNPLVKFRDFQAAKDMFELFYYNGGKKSRV